MILRFLPSGTSNGDAPIKYLLAKKDSKGAERIPPPVIVYGNPDVTKAIIDTCPRKFKYTSAVIAFRDNEHPTNLQIADVIHDLRHTLAPGMGPDRLDMFAVLHRDKGNTEIHIIFPMTDLKTGKQYNVMPPGKAGKQLASDWQAMWNHKLSYAQVVENPLKTQFSSLDMKVAKFASPSSLIHKRVRTKVKLSELVAEKIQSGHLKDRDDLIEFFQNSGMTITRQGKDYISVRGSDPKAKAIRLRGKPFSEGVQYADLLKEAEENASKGTRLSPTDAVLTELRVKRAILDREDFIRQRDSKVFTPRTYTLPGQPKPIRTPRIKVPTRKEKMLDAVNRVQKHLNVLRAEQAEQKSSESVSQEAKLQPTANKEISLPNIYKAERKQEQSSDHSIGSSGTQQSIEASIATLEGEITGAINRVNSSKDAQSAARAQLKVIELTQKLYMLRQRLKEEKIRELNRPKPIPGFAL